MMKNIVLPQQKVSSTPTSLVRWLPISVILIVAIVLFTWQIGFEGLWLDELNSIKDVVIQDPVEVYKTNQLRPLYYLLLMFWMRLGESDIWLRSMSVIFAVISVFLLYRLGRRLVGETEGLIAALILTLSPFFISHAQEIRMYALSLCLGLAGTLCLTEALLIAKPKQPSQKLMGGWALFRLLAIYTVPLNVTLLLPDVLIIFSRFRKEKAVLINFTKWLGLLLLLWSPSVLSVIDASSPNSDYAADHPGEVPPGPDRMIRVLKFFTVWPFAVQSNALVALFYKVFTLFLAGLIGAGIIRKHRSPNLWWTAAWFVLPTLPIIVFSYLSIPIWKARYLLFVSPYVFILFAAGMTRLWRQWKIAAIAMAAAYFMTVSGGLVHYYTVQNRADYKFNVATIVEDEQPGDAMVWSYECCEIGLRRYYKGDMEVYKPSLGNVKKPEDIQPWLAEFPTGYERLWLVMEPSKIRKEIESAIANAYSVEKAFDYGLGSKVMLLKPLAETTPQATPSENSQKAS